MKTNLLTILALGCSVLVVGCAARRRVIADYMFDITVLVTAEDGAPVQDAELTLDVNGPVYEGVTVVKTVKRLTNSTGGFVFGYISHEQGVKYTLTVHKEGFEPQIVSGSAPPVGHHTIRLKKVDSNG
jgi:hypothetical protein